MRVAIAFGLLLAVAVAGDAKPVDTNRVDGPAFDMTDRYQVEGLGACLALHAPQPEDRTGDINDIRQACQCAVGRFVAGRDTADLPSLRDDPKLIGGNYAACRAERAVIRAAATAAAETDQGAKDPETSASPGATSDLGEWLFRIDPAGWLGRTGLPTWAWGMIAAFVLLLMLKLRGRRDRGDLIAPPKSIRPPARVNPVSDEGES